MLEKTDLHNKTISRTSKSKRKKRTVDVLCLESAKFLIWTSKSKRWHPSMVRLSSAVTAIPADQTTWQFAGNVLNVHNPYGHPLA
ncbi:MAG: hypothetical protein WA364_08370 [Candidatus Nitrosopolaris sp.]